VLEQAKRSCAECGLSAKARSAESAFELEKQKGAASLLSDVHPTLVRILLDLPRFLWT
jgi:hypothetical protein